LMALSRSYQEKYKLVLSEVEWTQSLLLCVLVPWWLIVYLKKQMEVLTFLSVFCQEEYKPNFA
jgi:uncharacterized membrane protein YhdT